MHEPRHQVGGRRSDHDAVGGFGHVHVLDRSAHLAGRLGRKIEPWALVPPQVPHHRVAGQSLERERRDELDRRRRHDDDHRRSFLLEPAHQLARLVGGDPTRNPHHDDPSAQHPA